MKKLYYIQMEEYGLIATVDDEDDVKYTIRKDLPEGSIGKEKAEAILKAVKSDRNWNNDLDEGQLYDILCTEDVLAEMVRNF